MKSAISNKCNRQLLQEVKFTKMLNEKLAGSMFFGGACYIIARIGNSALSGECAA
jgi:hypothetical protein